MRTQPQDTEASRQGSQPCGARTPEGFSDAPACFATEVRDDGVYVALPAEAPKPRTVADVMVETMVNWGVTHVFGMVGHSNLGFADAMRVAEQRGDLTFVGIRHEGAAAFAAVAYGKLTGKLAGCFAIAGPGSTNLMTGLYDAKTDRAPVLALSGQVPSKDKGRGAFQDLDLEAAFADVARFSESVHSTANPAELMTLACKTAIVERDVAHLVFPDEVQELPAPENAKVGGPDGRTGDRHIAPPADALAEAVGAMTASDRPIVIVGNGAKEGMDEIIALAEKLEDASPNGIGENVERVHLFARVGRRGSLGHRLGDIRVFSGVHVRLPPELGGVAHHRLTGVGAHPSSALFLVDRFAGLDV